MHDIPRLPENMQDTFCDELTKLTCHFCDGAAVEEVVSNYFFSHHLIQYKKTFFV